MTSGTVSRMSRGVHLHTRGRAGGLNGWRGAVALLTLALGACDIPTGLPRFETRFVVPGENTTLAVAELLPSSVTVAGNNFRLALAAQPIPARSLADMCGAPCIALAGQTAPKPAFTASIPVSIDVPDDVASATLAGGSVAITLTHNFGFDPLHPSGRTEDGSIAVTVRSGATVIGSTTITGPFPSGTTKNAAITMPVGTQITGDLDVQIDLNSPAGGSAPQHWVPVNPNAMLTGSVTPNQVDISQAGVRLQNRTVNASNTELDLSDVDETMAERVKRGAIIVTINNPFTVTGTMNLVLTAPNTTVTKQIALGAGTTTQRIEFTGPELQSLLGNTVNMSLRGTLNSATPITVRPGQVISISTQMDLVFEIGGEG